MPRVTNERLVSYAKMIALNHEEEFAEVKRRIDEKLLERFRKGDAVTREAVAALMNANDIFMSELRVIISESIDQDSKNWLAPE